MKKYLLLSAIFILALSVSPGMSWADEKTANTKKTTWADVCSDIVGHYPIPADQTAVNPGQKRVLSQTKNWSFDVGVQYFLMSHTSYEFGNAEAPFQEPISRLEFPLNTWWMNFELRRTCPRWSMGLRAGLSVAKNVTGRVEDSDWENENSVDTVTTYSQSACREETSYLFRGDVDVNISDWLGLPPSFQIRPLFAFEFQRLSLMAHDGTQWDPWKETEAVNLSGDAMHLRQDYYMYQIGLRGVYDGFKIGKNVVIKLRGEADWGPVLGYNEDHHILRGRRYTVESTSGNSLYFSTGVDVEIAKTVTAGITMDYKFIRTTGTHHWTDTGVDEQWSNGVRVWSDQTSLMAHIAYAF